MMKAKSCFKDDDDDVYDFYDFYDDDDIDARNLPTRWPLLSVSDVSTKSLLSEVTRVHIRSEYE